MAWPASKQTRHNQHATHKHYQLSPCNGELDKNMVFDFFYFKENKSPAHTSKTNNFLNVSLTKHDFKEKVRSSNFLLEI